MSENNDSVKRILLTGGTGLIGSAFIKKYQHKYQFDVLTRQRVSVNCLFKKDENIQLLHGIRGLDDLNDYDAVINLAGEPIAEKRWSLQQKRNICHSRWNLTHRLSKRLNNSSSPPRVFISGSAIGYYGRQNSVEIDESFDECYQEFTHRVCKVWEQKALLSHAKTRVCLLRTGIVLDKNHGALKKMLLPYKMGLGGRFATGHQYMSWIHIDDMVRAIEFVLNHPHCQGSYNLTAPNPVTNAEFSATLAKILNRPNVATMPGFVLRLLFGEMADLFLFGQKVIPKKLTDAEFMFQHPQLEEALNDLLAP
ncbi:TIGR01777 family oxidoreductase [Thalassotalea sp. Y01]|uniref:TIGR01777 family oxidoreductase n=1 Tax=Thalassotalea sp. Y01 TaxID=2729613 RepID=UPI001B7D5A85|nr:TIGR01777 family oxidoreductase [Thalassotalea sp. Y01]